MNIRGQEKENQAGRGKVTKFKAIGGVVWKYYTTEASKLYTHIKAI